MLLRKTRKRKIQILYIMRKLNQWKTNYILEKRTLGTDFCKYCNKLLTYVTGQNN